MYVPQTFTINNVQSYLLSCSVDRTPVSFLIDTGAGVSLLSKEVWGRLNRTEEMLRPVVSQRIVRVDGIPIKIEGSVSVPVTIGNATFNHDFIVANEITTEAILGLDFLEAKKCMLDLACGKLQIADQSVTLTARPTQSSSQCAKVTVLKKIVIPPRSEMEVMARIDSKESGTWLLEGLQFKELRTYLCGQKYLNSKGANLTNTGHQSRPITCDTSQEYETCKCRNDQRGDYMLCW